jgi:hypothetical protein
VITDLNRSDAIAPLSSPDTFSKAPTRSIIWLSSPSRSGGTLQTAVGGNSPVSISRYWLLPFSAERLSNTIAFGLASRVPSQPADLARPARGREQQPDGEDSAPMFKAGRLAGLQRGVDRGNLPVGEQPLPAALSEPFHTKAGICGFPPHAPQLCVIEHDRRQREYPVRLIRRGARL